MCLESKQMREIEVMLKNTKMKVCGIAVACNITPSNVCRMKNKIELSELVTPIDCLNC
jgi:hypothetical protein